MSQGLATNVRKYVFDYFLSHGQAPVLEQIMREHRLSRTTAYSVLKDLETARHLVLIPGTQRILMANPFSNVTTPFKVKTVGREYFAACAWDLIAFHVMMDRKEVEINSYCHHCAEPIRIVLKNGKVESSQPRNPLVYISIPAARWWQNIVDTCSNNIVFYGSKEHLDEWLSKNPGLTGESLTVSKTLELSPPIYADKLNLDYARPTVDQLAAHFGALGLHGEFWKLK